MKFKSWAWGNRPAEAAKNGSSLGDTCCLPSQEGRLLLTNPSVAEGQKQVLMAVQRAAHNMTS